MICSRTPITTRSGSGTISTPCRTRSGACSPAPGSPACIGWCGGGWGGGGGGGRGGGAVWRGEVGARGGGAPAVLALAVVPFGMTFKAASRAHGKDARLARDFAYDLLQSVEPYGILFTNGAQHTS